MINKVLLFAKRTPCTEQEENHKHPSKINPTPPKKIIIIIVVMIIKKAQPNPPHL